MRNWLEPQITTCIVVAICLLLGGCVVVGVDGGRSDQYRGPGHVVAAYEELPNDIPGAYGFVDAANVASGSSFPDGPGELECQNLLESPGFTRLAAASTQLLHPPVPRFLTQWREKKQLPAAPAYPRFHPLPVRPVLTPALDQEGLDCATTSVQYGSIE